jgi:lysozyme family protein
MTTADIINGVLEREGSEFTDRPSDKGGPTKHGVTLPVLSEWRGQLATVEQLKALTKNEAYECFEHLFYIRSGFEKLADENIRALMVDWAITSGRERATRYLQRTIGAKVDGVFGPQTRNMANAVDARILLKKLGLARQDFYVDTAVLDDRIPDGVFESTNLENLKGWLRRNWRMAVEPL